MKFTKKPNVLFEQNMNHYMPINDGAKRLRELLSFVGSMDGELTEVNMYSDGHTHIEFSISGETYILSLFRKTTEEEKDHDTV